VHNKPATAETSSLNDVEEYLASLEFKHNFIRNFIESENINDIYLYEQNTKFYRELKKTLSKCNIVGSEYLGEGISPGKELIRHWKKLRHEDALNLSFPNESFDLMISQDVFEHMPDID
jgi:hypothetical protein